jgi:hypothetical protein
MAKLTLGQAAKQVGKSKPTISKAIKDGKLSGEKNDNGVYQIEVSELLRVYDAVSETTEASAPPAPQASAVSEVEKRFLEEKVADLEARLTDMKDERDTAQKEAREDRARMMALIEDKRPKGFWSRLTGK